MPTCWGQFHLPTCFAVWHAGYSALNSFHTLRWYVYSHNPSPPISRAIGSTLSVRAHTWGLFLEPSAGDQTPNQVLHIPSADSMRQNSIHCPAYVLGQRNAPHHSPHECGWCLHQAPSWCEGSLPVLLQNIDTLWTTEYDDSSAELEGTHTDYRVRLLFLYRISQASTCPRAFVQTLPEPSQAGAMTTSLESPFQPPSGWCTFS